jgi:putative acetyltransferase
VAEADRRGEPVVVLEGDPRYYGRLGFLFAPDHGIHIDLPDWAPPEAAQVCPLSSYDPQVRGRVEYPPAIAAVSG